MKIIVNGEWKEIDDESRVSDLISQLEIADHRGVAIAVDEEVVPKSAWSTTRLAEGKRIEVVRAVQGG